MSAHITTHTALLFSRDNGRLRGLDIYVAFVAVVANRSPAEARSGRSHESSAATDRKSMIIRTHKISIAA